MTTRDKLRDMVVYLLNSEPTDDSEVIDGYTDSLMIGFEDVKNCDSSDVGGSAINVDELIEKLEEASEYWRDYDNSRGYQVGLDKARMIAVEMKNGGVKLI
jgi:hypothetical protein